MSSTPTTWTEITDTEALTRLVGEPLPRVRDKARHALTDLDIDWLSSSPFCVVATASADGACDASPKGDPAGELVHVIDEKTIALAERPGNRRADGYRNILQNPYVGLLFVIPGVRRRAAGARLALHVRALRDHPGRARGTGPDGRARHRADSAVRPRHANGHRERHGHLHLGKRPAGNAKKSAAHRHGSRAGAPRRSMQWPFTRAVAAAATAPRDVPQGHGQSHASARKHHHGHRQSPAERQRFS